MEISSHTLSHHMALQAAYLMLLHTLLYVLYQCVRLWTLWHSWLWWIPEDERSVHVLNYGGSHQIVWACAMVPIPALTVHRRPTKIPGSHGCYWGKSALSDAWLSWGLRDKTGGGWDRGTHVHLEQSGQEAFVGTDSDNVHWSLPNALPSILTQTHTSSRHAVSTGFIPEGSTQRLARCSMCMI